jgi:hypothetical protein
MFDLIRGLIEILVSFSLNKEIRRRTDVMGISTFGSLVWCRLIERRIHVRGSSF